ncbi:MAG: hypothetical protein ACR2MR_13520 [Dietzia maris]
MSLSDEQKKFGRVVYDDVPDILQTDSNKTQSRKKCILIKGTGPTLCTSASIRNVGYHHKTISGEQLIKDTGNITRIYSGGGQHNFIVKPFIDSGGYSVDDTQNAEMEVTVFATGFMDDVTIFENIITRGSFDNTGKLGVALADNTKNDDAYPNGFEDLIKRGVKGYIRYNAFVRQIWWDSDNPDQNQFDGVSDIVGSSVGADSSGGRMAINGIGYVYRPLDFMSLYAFNHKMGLHAWTVHNKINTDCDVDRDGYCLKEGYMGIDANPRTATTDLQIQQSQTNIHTIPIKLNPDRFDPKKPWVLEVQGFIYIPENVNTPNIPPSTENTTLFTNDDYPAALVPQSERYSEGNELSLGYDNELGLTYDGRVNGLDWYMRLSDIIYNVCGLSVWASID